jgi:SAM-dependent methyltransferase
LPTYQAPESSLRIRKVAVDLHDRRAADLDHEYAQLRNQSRFYSAFTYGRAQIDLVLDDTLGRFSPGASVLDIGCGTGEQLLRCERLGLRTTGLEPSAEMRALAGQRRLSASIVDGSIIDLPFPAATFDLVLALEVLRYLDRGDIERSYREMLRVLRPGGVMFFTMVNRYALDGFWLHYQLKRVLARWRSGPAIEHCEFVTPAEVRASFRDLPVDEVTQHGRMFAALRIAYKAYPRLGARLARWVAPVDDAVAPRWAAPLAGHLIVVVTKNRGAA